MVESTYCRFNTWDIFIHPPLYLCLSEETLKDVGHLYLMSVPWEITDPTQRERVNV